MSDFEDFDIQVIDPNDKLIPVFQSFLKASFEKDNFLDAVYTLMYENGFQNKTAVLNNKAYLMSLMEISLPDVYKAVNDLFRKWHRAKKAIIDALPMDEQDKIYKARELRYTKISPFIRKNWNELLIMFGVEVTPASKKTSGKETPATPSSVDKDLDDVTSDLTKTLNMSNSVSSLGATVYEHDTETGEIIKGEEIGEVGGSYDNADEIAEKKYQSKDELIQRKVFLKKCVDFLTERLDKIIEEIGFEGLARVSLNDPFTIHDYLLSDVLEKVDIDNPLMIENVELN